MAFCSNCGQKLPDGARFCPACGAAISGTGAPQSQYPPQPSAPVKNTKGTVGLILGIAAVVLVVIIGAVVLLSAAHGARSAGAAEQPPAPTPGQADVFGFAPDEPDDEPETENEPEIEKTGNAALDTLLADYQDIIDTVLDGVTDSWAADYNCGYMYDYDFDGYPELVALYCQDGMQLHALVARRLADGTPRVLDQYVCPLAGGASATIYSGTIANVPMLHIVYENYDGDMAVGRDTVIALSDTDFELMYNLTWEESMDGSSVTHLVGGEEDEAVFRMVYGARDYYECSFPNDEHVPLDGVIEEYLSWGRGE